MSLTYVLSLEEWSQFWSIKLFLPDLLTVQEILRLAFWKRHEEAIVNAFLHRSTEIFFLLIIWDKKSRICKTARQK